jgi:hypothetical protein
LLAEKENMPDNPNMPGGALPPKPGDAKVQPKKETVRINLPPKPTSAPTIKLPTLAPGAPPPSAASAAAPVAASAAPRSASAAPPPPVPPAAASSQIARAAAPAAAPTATKAPAPAAAPMRSAPVVVTGVKTLDLSLAIAAAVVALAAAGSTAWLVFGGIPGITQQ